ncbi:hypothetical protein MASR2M47_07510 [Draconibacterium sp.]
MYLTAIIDVYSRYIVGWDVLITLMQKTASPFLKLQQPTMGKPEITNSDQGVSSRASCGRSMQKISVWTWTAKAGRHDNIFIERFWRTVKRTIILHCHDKYSIKGWRVRLIITAMKKHTEWGAFRLNYMSKWLDLVAGGNKPVDFKAYTE